MRCLWLVLAFVGLSIAASILPENLKPDPEYGDEFYLRRQEDILIAFRYMHQLHWLPELTSFGLYYKISDHYDNYDNLDEVKEFVDMYNRKGFLERGKPFSLYNAEHLKQVKLLFKLFMNAKDYTTYAKTVGWARYYINEKMFMYVLGTTLSHRKDLKTNIMPPPYEICPYQFINGEAIKSAHRLKMQGFYGVKEVDGLKEAIIPVNFTGWYLNVNPEQKVSYYTEDVGMNSFYYNYNLDYPHWLEGKPFGLDQDRRGEIFIMAHHEINARYYLERLANDLGHIPEFNWREPIKSGFYPSLMYYNGEALPSRANYYNYWQEGNHRFIREAEDRERRIRDVIDMGFITYGGETTRLSRPEDVNTLGNLLQGNPDSYGLHHNFHDHIVPSFLENTATAMRDPLFYQFYKKLIHNYWKFMSHIEPYTYDEMAFPGVKIVDVHVDKIETFFEPFDVDITNAVNTVPDPVDEAPKELKYGSFKPYDFMIKARTMRLNHKPFQYKLTVHSDKKVEASVRIFIGPKYDEFGSHISFNENRKNFVMLEMYPYTLEAGDNVITGKEFLFYGDRQTSYFDLYKNLLAAKKGEKEWSTKLSLARCTFPRNLMIPKGKKGGMPYQLFFVISPFLEPKVKFLSTFNILTSCGVGSGSRFMEDRAMLYPLDREIDVKTFYVPNVHFEDVKVYFTGEDKFASHE